MTEDCVAIKGKHPAWQIHKRLYNWVLHWAETKYGLIALIILAITEPICVPIPADVLVIGMCLGKPKKGIRYGVTCAIFSVLGGTIALLLGMAIGGENVIAVFDKIHLGPKVNLALEMYQKYDFWAIAISALTPVPYMLFSWLGGMAEVSIVKFVLVSIVFRTMRFGSEGVIFYLFGIKARHFIEKYFNLATIIVITLLALVAFVMKKLGAAFAP
ncbi:MAG: DedA family protein [Planctomycetes bacterium]|nr:DedA family protein [Planctomycetota bacterium]MBU1517668.1 DedA family protein [Planctomycetota bacterium]MBU2458708.1 DedA family protein [Planctomycetota bacterium]MBU2596149.1 DedA family protein [Planctomycetota bacterium]